MISGEEVPDHGELKLGQTVQLGYVNQNRDGLDPKKSVYEEISQGLETLALGNREVSSSLEYHRSRAQDPEGGILTSPSA